MSLSPLDLVWLTLNSLRSNPLRSTLTTVGVFMGVAAVSATLQVGEISRATIARRLEERTAPAITVWAWNALQADDVTFFQQRLPSLQAVSAENWGGRRSNELFRSFRRKLYPWSHAGVDSDGWLADRARSIYYRNRLHALSHECSH
ncbi:MAG: ABC transporter permease [Desertifilum sp.]|nr:ABC transporter permease [Desertifilum sp.]